MSRESPYYREILADLLERFQCDNINSKQYAAYLGMDAEKVRRFIAKGKLPGQKIEHTYIVPVRSIAIFEATTARAKE